MWWRVGVTGHRRFGDLARVEREVDDALDRLEPNGIEPDGIEVWSSLAEGADRLVVDRVLARTGGRLVAVLPLDPDDYRRDFESIESNHEFDRLLAAATEIRVTGPDDSGTRESAYERAGLDVVEHCDVLFALWDQQPSRGRGGTAEIVAAARAEGRPVEIVAVRR